LHRIVRKLSFAINAFFSADSVDFDPIDDWDLIGILVKDVIGHWIGKHFFLKYRDWSGR
jgi:hypothetical protein